MGQVLAGQAAGSHTRPTIAFRLFGVGERETTLFKSFIRLLDHRTRHQWVHRDERADLWVVGSGPVQRPQEGVKVLGLGDAGAAAFDARVAFPIHADELEACLDQLGNAILLARRFLGLPASEVPSTLRLVRWPPAHLLAQPPRLRMATLMTGREWTVEALAARAGVPVLEARTFAQDLAAGGLLGEPQGATGFEDTQPSAPAPLAQVQQGLLGRIRSRLGIGIARPQA